MNKNIENVQQNNLSIHNTIFIDQECPIFSKDREYLHIFYSSFISCKSEDNPGAIYWASSTSDILLNNIIIDSCSSSKKQNYGLIIGKVISVDIISLYNCISGLII